MIYGDKKLSPLFYYPNMEKQFTKVIKCVKMVKRRYARLKNGRFSA